MDSFLFAANAVLPIFLVMMLGNFLKYKKILTDEFLSQATKFVFFVATPALLFHDTANVDFYKTFDAKFIISIVALILVYTLLLWIFIPRFIKDSKKAGALIHCGFRSNFAILGLPLAKNIFDAVGVAKTEIVLAFGVPMFNILAVTCLVYFSDKKGDFKSTVSKMIKNPLIIGAVSGLLFSLFKIPIPKFVNTSIGYVGNLSLGLGLLILGASFSFKTFTQMFKSTILGTFLKLILSPVFAVGTGYLLGFRGVELMIIYIFFGGPTAINAYVMSKEMDSDSTLTSGIVVCTTGLCVLTMFLGIFTLKHFGLS